MLTGGTDLLYRKALATSHRPYVQVEVWVADGSERLERNLIYENGRVRASLSSRVTRTFDFEVTEDLFPFQIDDLLNPYSREIRAFRGIEMADGVRFSWQVFRGRITRVRLQPDGAVTINCSDRAWDVVKNNFETPENSQAGDPVTDEVRRLISDALANATFGTFDEFFQTVPVLSWEHDRARGLDEMATSVGAFWYCLANGDFVLRKVPWTVAGDPVVTMSDYTVVDSTGEPLILASNVERDREGIFNSITATGERTDGTAPVFHTSRDENPANPTFVEGPFGLQNKLLNLRTPTSQGGAKSAADDYLRRSTALTQTWDFTMPPDAALELGDILRLDARGQKNIIQVVAAFELPMDVEAVMTVSCRSQIIGPLEGET